MPSAQSMATEAARQKSVWASMQRRRLFMQGLEDHGQVEDGLSRANVTRNTYQRWRQKFPEFAAQVDAVRRDNGKGLSVPAHLGWKGSFAEFGRVYFGHDYAWFHLLAAEAMETAEGGDVIMFLWPPEHGKTTLSEDFANYKLATDPSYRITVGTETGDLGEKMLARIKMRMEPDGPARQYVRRFGPFVPMTGGTRKTAQPWANDHFDVFKKGRHDERDYSMQTLGMRSSVIGTRCDLLNIDDPQSRKSLGMTDFLLDVIRGDWLSRPGVSGHTVFNGSRQGENDIYKAMQTEGIVDRLIKLPAYDEDRVATHGSPWLWPEHYSERDYERLKRNAGDEAWERTYLQRDGLTRNMTFTPDMLGRCHNPLRAVWHDPPEDVRSIAIGLDPSIGGPNGFFVGGLTARKLVMLRSLSVRGLMSNQAILGEVEELCHAFHNDKHPVTDLIIEDKAFQKGMMEDTKLHELIARFGFRVTGHNTGADKYDENLGVPQIVHSLLREEVDLPYSEDKPTRDETDRFEEEMRMWRPHILGKRLRQDRVMAFWFVWMMWRKRRQQLKAAAQGTTQWQFKGLPYKPTKSGLIVVGGY